VSVNSNNLALDDADYTTAALRRFEAISLVPSGDVDPDRCSHTAGHHSLVGDVPEWLRILTAGKLRNSDLPELAIARCWDGDIDWPAEIADHGSDLRLLGASCDHGPTWPGVCTALEALRAAGHEPWLDVDLVVDHDGELGFLWGGVGILGIPSGDTLLSVNAALERAEVHWPASYTVHRRVDGVLQRDVLSAESARSSVDTMWLFTGGHGIVM
jgi:hypothetical protein